MRKHFGLILFVVICGIFAIKANADGKRAAAMLNMSKVEPIPITTTTTTATTTTVTTAIATQIQTFAVTQCTAMDIAVTETLPALATSLGKSVTDCQETQETGLGEAVSETRDSRVSENPPTLIRIPAQFDGRRTIVAEEGSSWTDFCYSEADACCLAAANGFELRESPPAGIYKVPHGISLSVPSSWQDGDGSWSLSPGLTIEVYQDPDCEQNPLEGFLTP